MGPEVVKIFTVNKTPRLGYIAGIILGDILGLNWEMVSDKRKLGKHYIINYSGENIRGAFKIRPDELLFEQGVRRREINVTTWKSLPVFFQTSSDSDLPFDIFAASFFLISRYEEYLEFEPDEYGRFRAARSVSFRNGFLDKPVVDLWAREFAKTMLRRFQTLAFRRNQFSAIATIDADEPFAYLGKSFKENFSGFFHDISKRKGHASDRYGSLTGREKDPYDIFEYIIERITYFNCTAGFFFPVGDPSHFDRNPVWKNRVYRNLISSIPSNFFTGIHPSFYSAERFMLPEEIGRLKTIIKKEVTESRFHYLKLKFPDSYRNLLKAGIFSDYSMGYSEETGFRAGIARPFFFYDLLADEPTPLKVIPFQIMDSTLTQNKKLKPEDAIIIIGKIMNEVAAVGGKFVTIWHNTSLLESDEWRRWRGVFEFTLESQSRSEEIQRL